MHRPTLHCGEYTTYLLKRPGVIPKSITQGGGALWMPFKQTPRQDIQAKQREVKTSSIGKRWYPASNTTSPT